jgi:hypothetical protein
MKTQNEKIKEVLDAECLDKMGKDYDGCSKCEKYWKSPTRCFNCHESDELTQKIMDVLEWKY